MQLYPGWSARDNYGLKKKRPSTGHTPNLSHSHKKAPRENNSMVNSPGHMNHHSPQRFGQPHHLINSPRMNSAKTPTQLETGKQSNGFGRVPVDTGYCLDCLNQKKCRARFGLEGQSQWCKHCRRKKKCTRFLEDDMSNHANNNMMMNNYHGSSSHRHGAGGGSNGNPSSLSSPTTLQSDNDDSINEPDADDILSRQVDSIEDDDDDEDEDDDVDEKHHTNDDDSDEENKQRHNHHHHPHHQPISMVHKPIPSKMDSHQQHHFQPPPPAHLYQPPTLPSHFLPGYHF